MKQAEELAQWLVRAQSALPEVLGFNSQCPYGSSHNCLQLWFQEIRHPHTYMSAGENTNAHLERKKLGHEAKSSVLPFSLFMPVFPPGLIPKDRDALLRLVGSLF